MITIENEQLKVAISSKGAELNSVYSKDTGLDYLWNGDPAFWGKHSPVLFPIVGTLKQDTYYFGDKAYKLSRHGFARDMEFTVTQQSAERVVLTLTDNATTLENYPFHFRLDLIYSLNENQLSVTYKISNTDSKLLHFSIGGHPAFRVPLAADTAFDDYYLEFEKQETTGRWPISNEGLITREPVDVLKGSNRIPLTKSLFQNDALVFKGLESKRISLKSDRTPHGLEFDLTGFPYLGVWAAKNADFVCIEPWCGIADSVDTTQQLTEKEGINKLLPDGVFERTWSIQLF